MKLIYCPRCKDIVKLESGMRSCSCGQSRGRYKDNTNAMIGGCAIPLGIHNSSFVNALQTRPTEGLGSRFDAFVIPVNCTTIEVED